MRTIKCVVVGDGGVGKTSLVVSYTTNKFPSGPYPIAAGNNFTVTVMIGEKPYTVGLFNSTGQDDFGRLRPLMYPQTDVFIICFSVVSHTSYESVKDRWESEIRHHCPNTPFLLVGTKIDLRDDDSTLEELSKNNQKPIAQKEGEQLANDLKAVKYMECSALTNKGLKNVFDEAILIALESLERTKTKRCTIF